MLLEKGVNTNEPQSIYYLRYRFNPILLARKLEKSFVGVVQSLCDAEGVQFHDDLLMILLRE